MGFTQIKFYEHVYQNVVCLHLFGKKTELMTSAIKLTMRNKKYAHFCVIPYSCHKVLQELGLWNPLKTSCLTSSSHNNDMKYTAAADVQISKQPMLLMYSCHTALQQIVALGAPPTQHLTHSFVWYITHTLPHTILQHQTPQYVGQWLLSITVMLLCGHASCNIEVECLD